MRGAAEAAFARASALVELLDAARERGAIVLLASHDPALRRALGCREVRLAGGRLEAAV